MTYCRVGPFFCRLDQNIVDLTYCRLDLLSKRLHPIQISFFLHYRSITTYLRKAASKELSPTLVISNCIQDRCRLCYNLSTTWLLFPFAAEICPFQNKIRDDVTVTSSLNRFFMKFWMQLDFTSTDHERLSWHGCGSECFIFVLVISLAETTFQTNACLN